MSQPGIAGSTPAQATSQLGDTLRQARRAQKLTLRVLASSVDCSESMLSKIERGRAQPSLRLLHALAAMLHVKVAALLADEAPGPVTIRRPGERLRLLLSSPHGGSRPVILERAVPFAEGMLLDANIHRIPPGGGSEGQYEHDAEEVGYVIRGAFELTVDGVIYVLDEGSSFYFNSRLPHSYMNNTTEDVVVFWVNGFGS